MVINQRHSALQFCAHKPNAISRSGKVSTLLHSPVQTLHYETLSAWMLSLMSRRAHLGHAADESDLGNALALVLAQRRREMRFASCQRVSDEKRDSSAASEKDTLRWSHAQ